MSYERTSKVDAVSVAVSTAVWKRSKAKGVPRLVLLAIADEANDDGLCTAYRRSQSWLAGKANCSVESVRRAVDALEALGELQVLAQGEGRKSTDYRVTIDEPPQTEGTRIEGAEPKNRGGSAHKARGQTPQTEGAIIPLSPGDDRSSPKSSSNAVARLDEWADDLPEVVKRSGLVDAARELCGLLETTLTERGYRNTIGKASSKRWLLDMEALLRVDERPVAQVRWVIRWLHQGDDRVARFWRTNVRSPDKLRVQWDVMREQYRALEQSTNKRADAAAQHARAQGRDPDEARADADALVESMFANTSADGDSALISGPVIDVDSRGA